MKQYTFKNLLKPTNISESNEGYEKVMKWFFAYPAKEVSLNDLTRLVGISKTTANRIVTQLAREGFLKIQRLGKVWRISCDQRHQFNSTRKVSYNLELVYNAQIIRSILSGIPNARSIILFGSYRKGDDTEKSDIDVAVEILNDDEVRIVTPGIIPRLGYRKNIKVNLLIFSRNNVDRNLFANIVNGIVLYGFLEAKP